jgi:hypothetical protein
LLRTGEQQRRVVGRDRFDERVHQVEVCAGVADERRAGRGRVGHQRPLLAGQKVKVGDGAVTV